MRVFAIYTLLISVAFAGKPTAEYLLLEAIRDSAKEGWEYSARGGYVFKAQLDLVGDEHPERLMCFSIDGYNRFHIFSNTERDEYLGALSWDLVCHHPRLKTGGESTFLSISLGHNVRFEEEEPFTKKVIKTKISSRGVDVSERVVGIGYEAVDDKEFIAIQNHQISPIVDAYTGIPEIRYKTLASFLTENSEWLVYKDNDWRVLDGFGYRVHKSDIETVREIRHSDNEHYIKYLVGDFTKEKALEIFAGNLLDSNGIKKRKGKAEGVLVQENNGNRIKVNANESASKTKTKEIEQLNEHRLFPLFIVGILSVAVYIFQGKRKRQTKGGNAKSKDQKYPHPNQE